MLACAVWTIEGDTIMRARAIAKTAMPIRTYLIDCEREGFSVEISGTSGLESVTLDDPARTFSCISSGVIVLTLSLGTRL